jgi:hypothetical protein
MFLLLLGLAGSAAAQTPIEQPEQSFVTSVRKGGSLGVGLGIGAPTGLSARLWFGDWSALQVGLGGNLGVNRSVVATADYLVTLKNISGPGGEYILPIYIGAGLKADVDMASKNALSLGPRLVLGGAVLIPDLPIDLFLEFTPTFYVMEVAGWSSDGRLGVHYYF